MRPRNETPEKWAPVVFNSPHGASSDSSFLATMAPASVSAPCKLWFSTSVWFSDESESCFPVCLACFLLWIREWQLWSFLRIGAEAGRALTVGSYQQQSGVPVLITDDPDGGPSTTVLWKAVRQREVQCILFDGGRLKSFLWGPWEWSGGLVREMNLEEFAVYLSHSVSLKSSSKAFKKYIYIYIYNV